MNPFLFVVRYFGYPMKKIIIPLVAIYSVLLLVFLIYYFNISDYYILDDWGNLQPLEALDKGVSFDSFMFQIVNNGSGTLGRPVSMLTLALDWVGSINHFSRFKTTNLALHLVCACLIFYFVKLLYVCSEVASATRREYIALGTAFFWLISPMHVSTVLYSVQRMAQLPAIFILLSLICYLYFRNKEIKYLWVGDVIAIFSATLFIILAVFSKENGAVGFGLLFAVELFFLKFRTGYKKSALVIGYYVLPTAILLIAAIAYQKGIVDYLLEGYLTRDFGLNERLLTQFNVVFDYLVNLIVPNINKMTVFHDGYPVARSFQEQLSAIVKFTLIALPLVIYFLRRTGSLKIIAFGLIFYLIAISIESSIIPLELYFEHRNYLPSIGIFLILSHVISIILERPTITRYKLAIAGSVTIYAVVVLLQLSMLARVWSSENSLIAHSLRIYPNSIRLNSSLVYLLIEQKKFDQAEIMYEIASKENSGVSPVVAAAMLSAYCSAGTSPPNGIYEKLNGEWNHLAVSNVVASIRFVGMMTMKGMCTSIDSEKVLNVIRNKIWRLSNRPNAVWRLNVAAAYLLIGQKRYTEAIYYLQMAWDMYPEVIDPALFLIDISIKLDSRSMLADIVTKLDFDSDKISPDEKKVLEEIREEFLDGVSRIRYLPK